MALRLNLAKLEALLRSFYTVTHLRVGVFDLDGREILGYPKTHCAFCGLIRTDAKRLALCRQSDAEAFEEARKRAGVYLYRCHAGLCEAVAPLLHGGVPVAYIMLGQAAPLPNEGEAMDELRARFADCPDFPALALAFSQLTPRTPQELSACALIMSACAGFIYLDAMVLPDRGSIAVRLADYIDANLDRRITLDDMAAALGVGKTSLCAYTRQAFDSTPHALLTARRMEKAARLLSETEMSVAAVACAVGMPDYNYFSRAFKRHKGETPSECRARANHRA